MVTLNLRNLVGEIGNRKDIEGDDRVGGWGGGEAQKSISPGYKVRILQNTSGFTRDY